MEKLEIFKKYIDQHHVKGHSERTIENYVHHLEKFFDFCLPKHCSNLSSQDVNDYLVVLSDSDAGTSFKNQAINAIKFYFIFVLNKKIKAHLVVRPKKELTQPILLDISEIQAMFDVCTNIKHRTILMILYSTGARVSEVVNLKIEDVDDRLMVIRIKSGKGNKDRLVPLTFSVLEKIRLYEKEYNPKIWLFNGQVFKGESPDTIKQYTAKSIEEVVKQLAVKAGIKKRVYPHLFRHNSLTNMLEVGEDLRTIQAVAGHSNISTTQRYLHLSPQLIANVNSPINNIRL